MFIDHYSMKTSSQPDVLVAEDLRKSYGPRRALQGLTFSLKAGRILGFLGPNGAGKTTSIRILTTMLEPESGHFSVNGVSSRDPERIRRMIGVLPENLGFPKQMTGIEYLTFFGRLYGRRTANARDYAMTLLQEVGLQKRGKSLIGTYSHGMRQRIGIARALVNNPMPHIKKVTQVGEMKGLLRIELEAPDNGKASKREEEINNSILGALIRAKVPILGFEIEGGKLQDI